MFELEEYAKGAATLFGFVVVTLLILLAITMVCKLFWFLFTTM